MPRPADDLISLLQHNSNRLSKILAGTVTPEELRSVDAIVEIARQKIRQLKRSAVGELDGGRAIAEAEERLDELKTRLTHVQGSRYYEDDCE